MEAILLWGWENEQEKWERYPVLNKYEDIEETSFWIWAISEYKPVQILSDREEQEFAVILPRLYSEDWHCCIFGISAAEFVYFLAFCGDFLQQIYPLENLKKLTKRLQENGFDMEEFLANEKA